MLNFIYGALSIWFIFGVIAVCKYEFTKAKPEDWTDWLTVLITFPFFTVVLSMKVVNEACKTIKETIQFNWEHEWRWKWEEIKEKIKYRY